jgi:mono/diheme cytochrome c family protein
MLQRLIFERIEQRILVGTLSFLAIMAIVGWIAINEGARMQAFDQQFLARSIERGAYLYNANCSTCHGPNGLGLAGRAPALNSPYLFGHNFFADLDGEVTTLNIERAREGTTAERIAEIDARLTAIEGERSTRMVAMSKADTQTPGFYDPALPARTTNLEYAGSVRSFILTTLIHGRPNSVQYWNDPMVAWGQIAGGPMRMDQLEDIVNYIMNWNKGSEWTIEDLNAVNQFPISVVDASTVVASGDPRIAAPGTDANVDASMLDLTAINAELANFTGDPTNGQMLYNGALGCAGCHMNAAVAPPTEATWTRVQELRLTDAANAAFTGEEYLVHAILYPNEYISPGEPYRADPYPGGVMPGNFSGRLSYQELADLIAYIKSYDQPLP